MGGGAGRKTGTPGGVYRGRHTVGVWVCGHELQLHTILTAPNSSGPLAIVQQRVGVQCNQQCGRNEIILDFVIIQIGYKRRS